jgi:hypothetical protein
MKATTLVDKLAQLRSAIADLKDQEEAIKAQILATGLTEIDSDMFRVTVSHQNGRLSTDWAAVKDSMWDSDLFRFTYAANTRHGAGSTVIRLTARKAVAA